MLSATNSTFKRDYHSESPNGHPAPLMMVFHCYPEGIRHFWTSELTFAPTDPGQGTRQNGTIDMIWNMMDFTPEGRAADSSKGSRDERHDSLPPIGHSG